MNGIESKPNYKLYSKSQVGVATFLGSPIAGAILMSQNLKALNQYEEAKRYLLIGFISTATLFLLAFIIPDNFPNSSISLFGLLAVIHWYKTTQESLYANHISMGGQKGSWGATIGIGMICLIVVFILVFSIVMMLPKGIL